MVEAVQRYLPAGIEARVPQGGLFLWLRLPGGGSAEDLLPLAQAAGVRFAPGQRFFPNPEDGRSYLRLNFASHPPELLVEGIRRLGRVMGRNAK